MKKYDRIINNIDATMSMENMPLLKEDAKKKSHKEDSTGWGAFFNGGE